MSRVREAESWVSWATSGDRSELSSLVAWWPICKQSTTNVARNRGNQLKRAEAVVSCRCREEGTRRASIYKFAWRPSRNRKGLELTLELGTKELLNHQGTRSHFSRGQNSRIGLRTNCNLRNPYTNEISCPRLDLEYWTCNPSAAPVSASIC